MARCGARRKADMHTPHVYTTLAAAARASLPGELSAVADQSDSMHKEFVDLKTVATHPSLHPHVAVASPLSRTHDGIVRHVQATMQP